jgi:capsular polysaccharide biosynthesis protein
MRRTSVHPKAFEIFDRLSGLAKESNLPKYERIYVSRSRVSGRDLINELEVEAYFRSKDFFIVHPQEHTIEDQIKLFASAKLVASVGGSGAHTAVFSKPDARVLILSSSGWLVNADMLLSQVPDRLGYVFGEPLEDKGLARNKSAWSIPIADVATAVRRHFEI